MIPKYISQLKLVYDISVWLIYYEIKVVECRNDTDAFNVLAASYTDLLTIMIKFSSLHYGRFWKRPVHEYRTRWLELITNRMGEKGRICFEVWNDFYLVTRNVNPYLCAYA